MKAIIAITLLAALAAAAPADTFKAWSMAHGKMYTASETARRFSIFQQNMRRIEELNAEGHALFGLNSFADLTEEEFKAVYLRPMPAYNKTVFAPKSVAALPADHDWRKVTGVVGAVKNQGSCGSCWAFSTVAYLEGNLVHKQGKAQTVLAEQQLVDCDHECQDPEKTACDSGCNGGWMSTAMTYALKDGMMTEKDYGYTGRDGTCKYAAEKVAAKYAGTVKVIAEGDEKALQESLYTEGPIAIAVHADPWQLYFGGIFDKTSCSSDPAKLDHGVAAVGWGHDAASNKDFWIIRNSWGPSWGEQGYIRIRMGFNMCGLANSATLLA